MIHVLLKIRTSSQIKIFLNLRNQQIKMNQILLFIYVMQLFSFMLIIFDEFRGIQGLGP